MFTVAVIYLAGWYFGTRMVSLSDPRLAPMIKAIAGVDRATFGFTSIPTNALVYLDSRPSARSDVTLCIYDTPELYGDIHRNIELRKTATGYEWLREFETHPGPKTFKQSGHTAHETISIIYDTTGISGVAPNKLHVYYDGFDRRIVSGKDLTLDEVRPILVEWSQKR
jgi:hypothetical protein